MSVCQSVLCLSAVFAVFACVLLGCCLGGWRLDWSEGLKTGDGAKKGTNGRDASNEDDGTEYIKRETEIEEIRVDGNEVE